MEPRRLIAVSNRLPVVVETDPNTGKTTLNKGTGGLITALGPVLERHRGQWIGWLGPGAGQASASDLDDAAKRIGHDLSAVELSDEEIQGYYNGFSNEVLWPLFHDFIDHCNFDPRYWPIYEQVNQKFARAVAQGSNADDYIWIHDYQLLLVGRELEKMNVHRESGFFLHIPFPPLDVFDKLPWRNEVLESMLSYRLIGFQTRRDVRNFLQCVRHRASGATIEERPDGRFMITFEGRASIAAEFAISIDYDDFLQRSVENEVSEMVARLRARLPGRTLILGLDRLDYSKGIPQRVSAFGNALERYPELRQKVSLVQVVVPSRTLVGEYQDLKENIERLISEVNGRFTAEGWSPILYIFRRLGSTELLSYYRVSDVALVTPLKDGMNLVCKEYCVCSLEGHGVLILSEFAGAAAELENDSLIVNPFDIEQTADAIHQAVMMPVPERQEHMQRLRAYIREHDIYRWTREFLDAAEDARKLPKPASPPPNA